MTEIIFCGTPKRARTVQRGVRSTESYALVRSIKHTYSGIRFFRASSCNRRITNIISVVGRFGRKPLCSSGRIPTRSQYSLRRRGVRYQQDAPVVAAVCPILLFVEYHDDGIFPLLRHLAPPQIRTAISSSLRRRAGSPLRVILNSSTETPYGSTAFPFANERMASVSSCIVR